MTITANCPRCDAPITDTDEDDLVAKAQTHAREDHGLAHTLPRKQHPRPTPRKNYREELNLNQLTWA